MKPPQQPPQQARPPGQRVLTPLLQEGPFPARVLEEIKSYAGNECVQGLPDCLPD